MCEFVSTLPDQTRQLTQHCKHCKPVSASPDQTSVRRDIKSLSDSNKCCKLSCCKSCTYCTRAVAKERHKSDCCKTTSVIKICEQCFLCQSVVFCQTCTTCPNCCTISACRGQTQPVLGNLGSLGARPKLLQMLKEGYTLPFPD